jgi:hypothetical protein
MITSTFTTLVRGPSKEKLEKKTSRRKKSDAEDEQNHHFCPLSSSLLRCCEFFLYNH